MNTLRGFLAGMLLFMACAAFGDVPAPPQDTRIEDLAGILNGAQIHALDSKMDSLENATGTRIEILTVPDLGADTIVKYASRVDASWYPEENAVDKHVLIVVAAREKTASIVVGEGLKDILPEGVAASILSGKLLPALKAGHPDAGLAAGIDAVSAKIEEARVEDVSPPLHTLLIKPASMGEIFRYLLIIVGVLGLLAAMVYAGRRKDLSEYLKSRRKRYPFR